ncbi:MAG: peptide chain release factor N(5)-glutamine methyltransferase [bacterium]
MPRLSAIYDWVQQNQKLKVNKIPFSEINTIISGITGIPKQVLLVHSDIRVSSSELKKIQKAITKRIDHYPLQYILGFVEFMGIRFFINEGVLIPRPETELLVETALKYIDELQYETILDLCCGSGVVGLSIAYLNKQTHVSLCDNSSKAINLTRKNSQLLGLNHRCTLFKSDLFSGIPVSSKFDLIVSNPPYVPEERLSSLPKEINYEPVEAINGGEKGMELISRIIQQVGSYLNKSGMLIIEHDDTQKRYLERIGIVDTGSTLKYVKTINDLSGLPRVSVFVSSS